MSPIDLARLAFLGAIWGGSYILLRVAVPEVGSLVTATLRATLAGVTLLGFASINGVAMHWRRNAKVFAVFGLFATALPFSFFSYASLYLPAAYCALLNSTVPLFSAVFSVLWLADRLTLRKIAGLAAGVCGVAILVGAGALALNATILLAAAAGLFASACMAIAGIIAIKTSRPAPGASSGIDPIAMSTGSMIAGSLMMAPFVPFSLPSTMPSMLAIACVAGLSLLCSALAQAMFIPMIVRLGPTRAMSVTFLIPLFSMLFGYLFLQEAVHLSTLIGGAVVLAAMGLVLSGPPIQPKAALTAEATYPVSIDALSTRQDAGTPRV